MRLAASSRNFLFGDYPRPWQPRALFLGPPGGHGIPHLLKRLVLLRRDSDMAQGSPDGREVNLQPSRARGNDAQVQGIHGRSGAQVGCQRIHEYATPGKLQVDFAAIRGASCHAAVASEERESFEQMWDAVPAGWPKEECAR